MTGWVCNEDEFNRLWYPDYCGGHLEFYPQAKLTHIFVMDFLAHFVQDPQFIENQPSSLDVGKFLKSRLFLKETVAS